MDKNRLKQQVKIIIKQGLRAPKNKLLWHNQWMSVFQTPQGFTFAQRKGKDSVGILAYRSKPLSSNTQVQYLLKDQVKPALGYQKYWSIISGTINKDLPLADIATQQLLQQGGFKRGSPIYLGYMVSSTQTSQLVRLFCIDVTGLQQSKPKGDGSHGDLGQLMWADIDFVNRNVYDPKVIFAINKMKIMGVIK